MVIGSAPCHAGPMAFRARLERLEAAVHLERRADDRVVAGVASGIAARIAVDPYLVRVLLVLASLAGGVGAVIYLVSWALSTGPVPSNALSAIEPDRRRTAAVACLAAGGLVACRWVGLWPGDALMGPAVAVAAGAAVSGSRTQSMERLFTGRVSVARVIVGVGLAMSGLVVLAARGGSIDDLRRSAFTVALALLGVVVVLGPWFGRLARDLAEERRERVRGEERAEMATHLHDSVLQTLALIQRSADDPRRTVTLARRQERDLRSWLYGGRDEPEPEASLHRAIDKMAQEIEEAYDLRIDVVVVGDRRVDEPAAAVLGAIREALVNAARHAGADDVAVYVEVEAHHLSAYVRDRGVGFDPGTVPASRRGISDSIRGRIERAGGTASVRSSPQQGTEIDLAIPIP